MSDIEQEAKKALREAISFAHGNLYTANGKAWRQIIASLAFETKADLSLIQNFDEQDQARFHLVTQGFINRDLEVGDLIDAYLEFFPRPKEWKDFE